MGILMIINYFRYLLYPELQTNSVLLERNYEGLLRISLHGQIEGEAIETTAILAVLYDNKLEANP